MARVFDSNVANYMSRGSVNLGLNGLTAYSLAFWVKPTNTPGADEGLVVKESSGGWWTIFSQMTVAAPAGRITFAVENDSLVEFPQWTTSAALAVGVWTRVLFTLQVSAGGASDGIIYVNGQAVSTTFAGTYTASFTLDELSNTLFYGQFSGANPLDAALAWVCIWNRQLTAQEALLDYSNPRNVKSGLLSIVELSPDVDQGSIGGSMTVNGTLAPTGGPPVSSATTNLENLFCKF